MTIPMNITHVVRGNEYLSSSPNMYVCTKLSDGRYRYISMPLITDENHKKLSKEADMLPSGGSDRSGFITEAIVNYVALLDGARRIIAEIFLWMN